jgi:hypothetical protein
VEDEWDEVGGVLGVGYHGDFVGDATIYIRVLRGRRFGRGSGLDGSIVGWWGVEERLGRLLKPRVSEINLLCRKSYVQGV